MKPQVNIVALVDVMGALSEGTLGNGNLALVDDGSFQSTGQGTPELCTVCAPGQVVQWTALAVDLQTPVAIKNITFLGPEDGTEEYQGAPTEESEKLAQETWTGVVPAYMPSKVPHKYRLELQMYEGKNSVMHVESPALMCQ